MREEKGVRVWVKNISLEEGEVWESEKGIRVNNRKGDEVETQDKKCKKRGEEDLRGRDRGCVCVWGGCSSKLKRIKKDRFHYPSSSPKPFHLDFGIQFGKKLEL